mgnify:FL=1
MAKIKIALEYTNTAELEAKKDAALREETNRYSNAYKPLELAFYKEFAKSKVEFHIVDQYSHIQRKFSSEYKFLSEYGPDGNLYKISDKKTKKYCVEIWACVKNAFISEPRFIESEAHEWYNAIMGEDYMRARKFLNRKTIKNILDEMCKVVSENADNRSNILEHYNAMIEKAKQIQKISADYKDVDEFVRAVNEEAKKLGYYACLKNNSFEFHKSLEHGRYSNSITAYATLPYSKEKEDECILFTNELFEQVMQPLHDALKVDTSWEDKYKDLFYFNKMKTKVKVHVSDGNGRYWLNHVKEYSKTDFTEVNFKNWLKNVEVNERRHLTNEFLKKARSI